MSSLYPDESYCTSDLGRILYQLKTDWDCVATVNECSEEKHLGGSHTAYSLDIRCSPSIADQNERVFGLTTRYKEMHRLHGALAKLHKQLYLRGTFPVFPAPKLIGSADPNVVNERRLAIETVLNFVFDSEVLRKARALHEFIEKAREEVHTAREATQNQVFFDNSTSILDQPNGIGEELNDVLVPTCSDQENSTDFQFPDVAITSEVEKTEKTRKSSMRRLFPKIYAGGQHIVDDNCQQQADYLVKAGQFVATAQRAEQEHAYELAFQCYKNAASSLIQGVQLENDMARRNAVRRKTAKYLVKAEKLYRTYLSLDGSVFNFEGLLTAAMRDPNILAFQCSNKSMKNYRFVGVLPNIDADRKVLLVEEKSTSKRYVMKLLEKGNYSPESRIFLPTNIPHMVHLVQFFETDMHIILLLEFIEPGRLSKFLSRYFEEAETRHLMWMAEMKAEVRDGEQISQIAIPSRNQDRGSYRGRRLLFTVGVDFERVVEMRDQTFSTDEPCAESTVICSVGEDAAGRSDAPIDDFSIPANSTDVIQSEYIRVEEESPAPIRIATCTPPGGNRISNDIPSTSTDDRRVIEEPVGGEAFSLNLAKALGAVRQQLGLRRRTWNHLDLPECLITHWSAQIVSFLFVMHTEHAEYLGDLNLENILLDTDGNLMITYHGRWYDSNERHHFIDGYAAPECHEYGWQPSVASDVWSLGAIMFELLAGRCLGNAAPHGVLKNMELPFPEDGRVSFVAKDILNMILTPIAACRPSLDEIRAHPFFRHIDWRLYDNPTSLTEPVPSVSREIPMFSMEGDDML